MTAPELVAGVDPRILLIADHASAAVPPGIDLGVAPEVMATHIAVDIGVAALSRDLAEALNARAVIATVSRLVVDLNRDPAAPGLIPEISDGRLIPGNAALDASKRARRLAAFHVPYHAAIERLIEARLPTLLVSVHSFTPTLASRPAEVRPWAIGILHNTDSRAAAPAIAALRAQGLTVGDNQPYSGRDLNYTMDRHAEARGLPYLGLEIRQDLLMTPADVIRWRELLVPVIRSSCTPAAPASPPGRTAAPARSRCR